MVFPLVREMAAAGTPDSNRVRVPVAVALRVLGLSRQGYYQWPKEPVSQRDWDDAHLLDVILEVHEDDATLGYRLNRPGFSSYAFPWPASAGWADSWAA